MATTMERMTTRVRAVIRHRVPALMMVWTASVASVATIVALPPGTSSAAPQTVVDRIVAVVGDQVITLSDVRAAMDLGLLNGGVLSSPATAGQATPAQPAPALSEREVVDRLVERELMRVEVERFGAAGATAEEVAARVGAIRARFPSPEAFKAALDAHGLSEARLEAWLLDDIRIERYVDQRFGSAAQPTDEEVLQYYQSREREFLGADRRPRPFADVRDQVRRRLIDSRRRDMVEEWVAGLRRRAVPVLKDRSEGDRP